MHLSFVFAAARFHSGCGLHHSDVTALLPDMPVKSLHDAKHLRFQFTDRHVFSPLFIQTVQALSQLL